LTHWGNSGKLYAEDTMNELQRNQDQLHRAFYGEAWHGEAILEVLNGVTTTIAASRPIPQAHSIWEIVKHITLWNDIVRGRIEGDAVEPGAGEDWQTVVEVSDDAWLDTLMELSRSFKDLEETLDDLKQAQFEENLPGRDYNAHFLIQGAIQHAAYHGGQIGILKKALLQA
jgi:uncharacterized damage-inducible protein DinB